MAGVDEQAQAMVGNRGPCWRGELNVSCAFDERGRPRIRGGGLHDGRSKPRHIASALPFSEGMLSCSFGGRLEGYEPINQLRSRAQIGDIVEGFFEAGNLLIEGDRTKVVL